MKDVTTMRFFWLSRWASTYCGGCGHVSLLSSSHTLTMPNQTASRRVLFLASKRLWFHEGVADVKATAGKQRI